MLDDLTATTLGVDTLDISTQTVKTRNRRARHCHRHRIGGTCSDRRPGSRFNFSASLISTESQNLQAANGPSSTSTSPPNRAKPSSAQGEGAGCGRRRIAANEMPHFSKLLEKLPTLVSRGCACSTTSPTGGRMMATVSVDHPLWHLARSRRRHRAIKVRRPASTGGR